jgi:hypothetical protein
LHILLLIPRGLTCVLSGCFERPYSACTSQKLSPSYYVKRKSPSRFSRTRIYQDNSALHHNPLPSSRSNCCVSYLSLPLYSFDLEPCFSVLLKAQGAPSKLGSAPCYQSIDAWCSFRCMFFCSCCCRESYVVFAAPIKFFY